METWVNRSVLVAHEGSEVGLLGCIILRKALDLAMMMPWFAEPA